MSTSTPVTSFTRYATIASGVAATTDAGTKHLTSSLQIARENDGGIVVLVNGAVVCRQYGPGASAIEKAIYANLS